MMMVHFNFHPIAPAIINLLQLLLNRESLKFFAILSVGDAIDFHGFTNHHFPACSFGTSLYLILSLSLRFVDEFGCF